VCRRAPLAPRIVATAIYSFVVAWNEYLYALTFVDDRSKFTSPVGLPHFFSGYGADWPGLVAASFITSVPVVALFLVLQKDFVRALTEGAIESCTGCSTRDEQPIVGRWHGRECRRSRRSRVTWWRWTASPSPSRTVVALVGPSGCGETTTLDLVARLLELGDGEIGIGDRLVNDLDPKDRNIATVFRNYAPSAKKTVYNALAFPFRVRRTQQAEIDREVRSAAALLGIEHLLARREPSGHQQQRMALGRALVRRPHVFLMDEPPSNLDAELRVQMRAELERFHRDLEVMVVDATHDQLEAVAMADRMAVTSNGCSRGTTLPSGCSPVRSTGSWRARWAARRRTRSRPRSWPRTGASGSSAPTAGGPKSLPPMPAML
jgi:ABC-type nitrate/sulfonate/bicarbonate transport system ATPase subunit